MDIIFLMILRLNWFGIAVVATLNGMVMDFNSIHHPGGKVMPSKPMVDVGGAWKDIIKEAMKCLPANPHPDLVVGALAHMVWMAREDLKDLKRRLSECTG